MVMGSCFSTKSATKNNVEKPQKKKKYVYGTRTTRDSTAGFSTGSMLYIASTSSGGCGCSCSGGDCGGCGDGGCGCGGGC